MKLSQLPLFAFFLFTALAHIPGAAANKYVDKGYVEDDNWVLENVLAYTETQHNHVESGGKHYFSGTAETSNAWYVWAKEGYPDTDDVRKQAVLDNVTEDANVQVAVAEKEWEGEKDHTWLSTDNSDKQHCKCPVYEERVDKRTVEGHNKVDEQTEDNPPVYVRTVQWAMGWATGDENHQKGVMSNYTYRQAGDECADCYGETGNTCPLGGE